MFRRTPEAAQALEEAPVRVIFDGLPVRCRRGDSVAAALLAAGVAACRETPVSGAQRGPFCMMGVCYDCLVVIDGQPNQQGCMMPVREGMVIERQRGARTV